MTNQPSNKSVFLITAACFLAFFIFGFTDNLKGPTLPALMAETGIGYGTGGNIFFGEYSGFLIATLVTGLLADRLGLKFVLILAGLCLTLGVIGYSSFSHVFLLGASFFIIGLGLGAFELGPNAIIINVHPERKGLFLNLMAVMHGLGSMLAPLFTGWLFAMNISWRIVYRWDLTLILIFLLVVLSIKFPASKDNSQIDFRAIPAIAFKGNMPWFYAAIGLYVAAEIGMASWLVTYQQQVRHLGVVDSTRSLSLFFATIMIGRFLGGFFVQRLGYLRSILIASIGGVVFTALGLFGPQQTLLLLPLTGLFFSFIFPTITAAVSDLHSEQTNTLLGVLFTFAGLGGVIGPFLVGWAADLFGLQIGFSVNLFLTLLLVLSIAQLMKGDRHGKGS